MGLDNCDWLASNLLRLKSIHVESIHQIVSDSLPIIYCLLDTWSLNRGPIEFSLIIDADSSKSSWRRLIFKVSWQDGLINESILPGYTWRAISLWFFIMLLLVEFASEVGNRLLWIGRLVAYQWGTHHIIGSLNHYRHLRRMVLREKLCWLAVASTWLIRITTDIK